MIKALNLQTSSNNTIKTILILIVLLTFSIQLFAHGDLSIRIENKTVEIKKEPNNALLYFERGYLYQQHADLKEALNDYLKSQKLGYSDNLIYFRKSQVYFLLEESNLALDQINKYSAFNNIDVKGKKLKSQILYKLKRYNEAISLYDYVINNTSDIRPQDFIEYCDIILSENNNNYSKVLETIDLGLDKLGDKTLSLRLKKLDYLKASFQNDKAIEEYNYFILEYNRKEFWYYKKAKFLIELNRLSEANINLQLAKVAIDQLGNKFKNTQSIKKLKENIIIQEQNINTQNHD